METEEDVVIYGAGKYGRLVYKQFWLDGRADHIKFFVVTDLECNPTEVYGIPVISVNDYISKRSNVKIIVAVKQAQTIEDLLNEKQLYNCVKVTSDVAKKIQKNWDNYLLSIPVKRNQLLLKSFVGRGYECNGKYIAEKIIRDKLNIQLFWETIPNRTYALPEEIIPIENDTIEYEIVLATSGVIVDNNNAAPSTKSKQQYFINTWHGTGPFKKVYASIASQKGNNEWMKTLKAAYNRVDLFISNSRDNTEMFRESFLYDGEILESGNPRNDILFQHSDIAVKVRRNLKIDEHQKIVLYAPTFRENEETTFLKYDLDMNSVLEMLNRRFGTEFILLYRFHHRLRFYQKCENFYPQGIDVTMYSDVMELVVAADVLITDYSSIMWDFSLQRRPVFLYHNDETEYVNERDFYWPVSRWPYMKAHSSEEMCQQILEFDEEKYLRDLEQFFKDDPSYDDGHATERVVERIMDVMKNPQKYGKE